MAYRNEEFYTSFEKHYHCYSLTHVGKPHLESGNNIIMPLSAFDRLERTSSVNYPMAFELRNLNSDQTTHCGVLEFTAEEGFIYLPNWVMENMKLQEYELLRVTNVSLEKVTSMKLQPHTKDFLDQILDPKAALEAILKKFSCLTTGDTIMVMQNERKYYIDVLETNPSSAVSVIETDCEVDIAPPLHYKEAENQWKKKEAVKEEAKEPENQSKQKEDVKEKAKFKPFTGKGWRLNWNLLRSRD